LVQPGLDEEHELDQWSYVCNGFGIELFVVGAHAKRKGITDIFGVDHFHSGDELVVVQPAEGRLVQGATPLPEFKHPLNPVYVFGGSNYALKPSDGGDYQHSVYSEGYELHAPLAGSIVIYDRLVKRG